MMNNWTKVETDTLVMIENDGEWHPRYFAYCDKDGVPKYWLYGCTSNNIPSFEDTAYANNIRLATKNEKKKIFGVN